MSNWQQFKESGTLNGAGAKQKLSLLIVDDEPEIVETLSETFAPHFDIKRSTSPSEALASFKEDAPQVVISDQRMPEMTGIELFRQLKEIDPSTVRILITGYSDINVVIDALNEELLWKYVTKPWNHEDITELVLSAARKYLSESESSVFATTRAFLGM